MTVVLSLCTNTFFTIQNAINVIRQISVNGILAIAMTFVIITAGIDLSVGSILAFAGVVAASVGHPGNSLLLSIMLGLAVGSACGLINAVIIANTQVPAFIVTLGMMTIARGATLTYTTGRSVIDLSDQFNFIGQGDLLGIPIPIYILVAVGAISYVVLHHARFGRFVYAIGGNEMAAKVSGVNIAKVKLIVYIMSGCLAGLAGIMLASRTGAGSPNAGSGYELNAIAAAVIGGVGFAGGRGTIIGTLVGALIIGVVQNGLDLLRVSSYIQLIVRGVIIIGAVLVDQISKK
jgi:ribose/xylose/arabinose/galactoside ABC-type transport system permease subunit